MALSTPNKNIEITQTLLGALGAAAATAAGTLAKHAGTASAGFIGSSTAGAILAVSDCVIAGATSVKKNRGPLNRHTVTAAVNLASQGLFAYAGYAAQAETAKEFFTPENASAIASASAGLALKITQIFLLAKMQPTPVSAGYQQASTGS